MNIYILIKAYKIGIMKVSTYQISCPKTIIPKTTQHLQQIGSIYIAKSKIVPKPMHQLAV